MKCEGILRERRKGRTMASRMISQGLVFFRGKKLDWNTLINRNRNNIKMHTYTLKNVNKETKRQEEMRSMSMNMNMNMNMRRTRA